jgi:hypothetical protein
MKAFLEQIMEQIKLGLQARGCVYVEAGVISTLTAFTVIQEEGCPTRRSDVSMRWNARMRCWPKFD